MVLKHRYLNGTSNRSRSERASGSFTEGKTSSFYELHDLPAGETLFACVEPTSGDLKPVLILEDFAGRPVRTGNFTGRDSAATLEYTVPADVAQRTDRNTLCIYPVACICAIAIATFLFT